jgi:hypothetical protein
VRQGTSAKTKHKSTETSLEAAQPCPLAALKLPILELVDAEVVLAPTENLGQIIKNGCGRAITTQSAEFAKVKQLFTAIDFTETKLGQAALMRDIVQPPTTLAEIKQRREAIRELKHDPELRKQVEECLANLKKRSIGGEPLEETALRALAPDLADISALNLSAVGTFLEAARTKLNPSSLLPRRAAALGKLLSGFDKKEIDPNSMLLKELVGSIGAALKSGDSDLYNGKAIVRLDRLRHENPIDSRKNTPWYVPALAFSKALIEPVIMISLVSMIANKLLPPLQPLSFATNI